MGDDDKTPTDKPPMPFAATDAPTISVEADAAGELHETPTVPGDADAIAAMAADATLTPEQLAANNRAFGYVAPAAAAELEGDVAEKALELCDAQCGTAVAVRCKLDKGHEDPEHPAHAKHPASGDPLHDSGHVRWAVDHAAAEVAAVARNRQLLADAQELERLSKLGHE